MNKKKVLIISGIVVLVILAIYLAFNPAWLTHPKYMIDEQYCEQDSDCRFDYYDNSAVNNFNQRIGGEFDINYDCTTTICSNNICEVNCNE